MVNNLQRNSYDEVPYPDLSYAQTHPERLAMLGKLLGLNPAPVENCRVLDIGTASGANLLPMAAVLPSSTFVGMDISGVQIKKAQEAVQATGLTNITFYQMDILDITPEFGQFDYIIAHGIYCWVPPNVREKLLDICRDNLAPQGVAYISYNTYPGWHTLDIIRNMMVYRTRDAVTPEEKSAQAREFVSFMAHALANDNASAYAAIFETYLNSRQTQTEAFDHFALLHDEMEPLNQPFYFHQFISDAKQHGLQYLSESDFPEVMPNGLSAEVMEHLGKIAHNTIELEQYMDFLRNRTFRRTLLCHQEAKVDRRLSIQPLLEFYVSSNAHTIQMETEKVEKGIETFEGGTGAHFSTDHAITKAAFHYLLDVKPRRVRFDDLLREAAIRTNVTDVSSDDQVALAANLLRAFTYSLDLVEFHTFMPQITTVVTERPLTTPFIRYQARYQRYIASLLHVRTELDNFNRLILTQLDGTNDHSTLLNFLVELAEEGKISLPTAEDMPKSPDELRQKLDTELEICLHNFAEMGLLLA